MATLYQTNLIQKISQINRIRCRLQHKMPVNLLMPVLNVWQVFEYTPLINLFKANVKNNSGVVTLNQILSKTANILQIFAINLLAN